MILKYLLLILFLTGQGGISYSQLNTETNSGTVNRMIDNGILFLRNKLVKFDSDKLYTLTYDKTNPEADYIARRVLTGLQGFRIIWGEEPDSSDVALRIADAMISVRYGNLKTDDYIGDKNVERKTTVKYALYIYEYPAEKLMDSLKFSESRNDKVKIDVLASYEDSQLPFMKGKLPEESSMSGYVIPSIMLGVSAAVIILFYSIRSK